MGFLMTAISDNDYRSYDLPCYPENAEERAAYIQELESRVVMEITDFDYRPSKIPLFLVELRVAA